MEKDFFLGASVILDFYKRSQSPLEPLVFMSLFYYKNFCYTSEAIVYPKLIDISHLI
jgi:hypothetical protein